MSEKSVSKFFGRTSRKTLLALLAGAAVVGASGGGPVGFSSARAEDVGAIKPSSPVQTLPNFVNLVKQVKPAVVSITSMIKADAVEGEGGGNMGGGGMGGMGGMPFPFPFPFQMAPQQSRQLIEARGSGFLISSDGYVVTNNHVVKGATKVTVTLDDGTALPAKIIGRDGKTDLALLKVTSPQKLPFIELGESDDVQPGEWVIAVGNPYGLGGTVTAGIVSARGRDINEGPYDNFIQIDAPINRGNSGGPLFTQDGKVVGVNTAILSPSGGGSIGIGFAIPSDTVRSVISQLRKTGHVVRGYLGVNAQVISPAMAKALNMPVPVPGAPPAGALVASVSPDSPAEKAGLKAEDIITDFNGQKVTSPHDLAVRVASVAPGSDVKIGYLRAGAAQSLTVKIGNLGKASNDGGLGGSAASGQHLGVSLTPLSADLRRQLGLGSDVHGVVVNDVQPGSAADQAGIRPGDVIQSVGNQAVESPRAAVTAVRSALAAKKPVLLRILRDGQSLFIAISPDGSGDSSGSTPDTGEDGDDQ
ncbi:Do family serine endopeptidase [Acetobacter farinalis]|uniref:Probable periplasmic serine endoprotease DegP-like n=1 Tax=Acetobacter farinalis TaxID=1260984 RepID=A0ABT3Q5H0_9PROT|nr:Do family serine endopeptidase [Acetobacter farinalis]MCX2560476.1 Do family serine endopeptidase [Acetobacter farinalis]NHO29381.1 Do family serine endopeptidase [Acetobacter farinalis]